MKIILFFMFFSIVFSSNSISQWITWQKTYGGPHFNEGTSIVETPDGGYLAVGNDRIGQIERTLVLRLNQLGDTLWAKFLMEDFPSKIIQTLDNNYVILGAYTTVIKIDIEGNIIWQSGPFDWDKIFNTIIQTSDGGYVICGRIDSGTLSHPYLFKINSEGDSLWEKVYTDSIFFGAFYDMDIANDNNFVMVGNFSDSAFISDKLSIMKTDQLGNVIWLQRYDSLMYYTTRGIVISPDNSIIIAGSFFISKFNSTGNLNWLKLYDSLNFIDLRNVTLTKDGNYVFTGTWDSIGNFTLYTVLLKTDTSGNELWHKLFGFNNSDRGEQVKSTSDSGYVIIGRREPYLAGQIYIIKTDKNGFANPPIGIVPISNSIPENYYLSQNYPNPFNPVTNIRFSTTESEIVKLLVCDILGKELAVLVNESLKPGSYEVKFDATNFASGLYFYTLESGSFRETKKMVLIK